MILLYSAINDYSAAKISDELSRRQIEYKWLCLSDFIESDLLSYKFGGINNKKHFTFTRDGFEIDFSKLSVVFVRSLDKILIEKRSEDILLNGWVNMEVGNFIREALEMSNCQWFPCSPTVLNHLETEKFTELFDAIDVGLRIPDTIVTNDYKLTLDFYRKHQGRIISKRYYTSRTNYNGVDINFPTSPVSLRDIGFVQHVKYSPSLFQEYIPKLKELRITVVGNHTVTAEIDSQKTHHTRHDWRNYDKKRTPYKIHKLPEEVVSKVVEIEKMKK